jgi:hypothetical protein
MELEWNQWNGCFKMTIVTIVVDFETRPDKIHPG